MFLHWLTLMITLSISEIIFQEFSVGIKTTLLFSFFTFKSNHSGESTCLNISHWITFLWSSSDIQHSCGNKEDIVDYHLGRNRNRFLENSPDDDFIASRGCEWSIVSVKYFKFNWRWKKTIEFKIDKIGNTLTNLSSLSYSIHIHVYQHLYLSMSN